MNRQLHGTSFPLRPAIKFYITSVPISSTSTNNSHPKFAMRYPKSRRPRTAARFLDDGSWTKHSACLSKLSEALLVCRYFHFTNSEGIKFNGKSPLEILRLLDQDRANAVFSLASEMERNKTEISFEFIPKLAGNFTKNMSNPLPFNFRIGVTTKLIMATIPHLEDWLFKVAYHLERPGKIPITVQDRETLQENSLRFHAWRSRNHSWISFQRNFHCEVIACE